MVQFTIRSIMPNRSTFRATQCNQGPYNYFKTPPKCGIFGILCKGAGRQVNYLIDEASTVGKGANSTISYVHHYLETHGLGETDAYLHADNCNRQNKNYFLWYLAWRIINKQTASLNQLFLFDRWTHKIWPRTLLQPDQEGVQNELYLVDF